MLALLPRPATCARALAITASPLLLLCPGLPSLPAGGGSLFSQEPSDSAFGSSLFYSAFEAAAPPPAAPSTGEAPVD
jgi:hypothetical protein